MQITSLKQTRRMNCGQTAVAMLTGKTITEVEGVYGHGHETFPREHVKAIAALGFYPDERGFQKYAGTLPEVALVRICWLKRSGGKLSTSGKVRRSGHLVLVVRGDFYDPNGTVYSIKHLAFRNAVVDSYLEVLVP